MTKKVATKTTEMKTKKVVAAAKKPAKKAAAKKKSTRATRAAKSPSSTLLGGLTVNERSHLVDLIDQGRAPVVAESTESLSVAFFVQDGVDRGDGNGKERRRPAFTVAMVAVGGELKGVGVAKVNPKDDEWDNERGRLIALARAVRAEAKMMQ